MRLSRIEISKSFARRMGSHALTVGVVIGLSAPTAYYVVARRSLAAEGRVVAQQAARVVKEVAERQPELWRYASIEILSGLEGYGDEGDLAKILLLDVRHRLLAVDLRVGDGRVPVGAVWATSPVKRNGRTIARVAVAMDPSRVVRDSVFLLAAFGLLGWVLGVLLHRRATGEVERSERTVRLLIQSLETARAGLEAELADATQRIARIAERTASLLEEDRAEIARDLHDGVGQSLYALKLRLELLADQLPDPELRTAATRTANLVDDAIGEVRTATKAMVPPALARLGLAGAVRAACDLVVSSGQVEVDLEIGTLPDDLPSAIASACYRVIQEGLTNAAKHAGARRIEVRLASEEGIIRIAVRDDGRGFDPAKVRRGVGLDGMKARVESLGGAVILQTREGHGTSLEARVPMSA